MPKRERKQKESQSTATADVEEGITKAPEQEAHEAKVKAELDGLLDEIDDVLETNAAEFVKAYVQKGGQ